MIKRKSIRLDSYSFILFFHIIDYSDLSIPIGTCTPSLSDLRTFIVRIGIVDVSQSF